MQYPHPPLRRWTLQRYEKMPYPRIGPYSILSTRNESCTSVFDIPLDDIETCHGSVNHLAHSLSQRAHRMRGIANQEHPIAGPLFDQGDVSFEGEKWLEVVEPVGEIRKDGVQATHALCHCGDAGIAPVAPVARGEKQASLNVVRVFGQHQTLHLSSQRDVHRIGPVWRLLNDKPDDVKVVVMERHLKVAQAPQR